MSRIVRNTLAIAVITAVFVVMNGARVVAAIADDDQSPMVAGIRTQPEGQTYGRWAVEWWQWMLSIPKPVNPLYEATGEHCAERQVDKVWFLAGSTTAEPVVRTCRIPAGKSIFFPLVNTGYAAFLNDPPNERTDACIRDRSRCTAPVEIEAWIDGFQVSDPLRFSTDEKGSPSPFFNVQLPRENVIGDPPLTEAQARELALSPSAEQGYYLFLRPLSRGAHTIRWTASGCVPGFSENITYHLTVAR
jgi:hypothetical protein